MALEGELKGFNGVTCTCGAKLTLQVCRSAAGYYLGYFCTCSGPISRETGYYPFRDLAEADLARAIPKNARTTEFRGSESLG
jgi:hypothetical protein